MTGRPSLYTEELASEICERISCDESLASICREEGKPHMATVFRWLEKHESFRDKYARARVWQAETQADQGREIRQAVADGKLDPAQARVILDAIKWEAGKRDPKKYGDKVALVGGDPAAGDKPVQVNVTGLSESAMAEIAVLKVEGE